MAEPNKLFKKYKRRFINKLGRKSTYNDQLDALGGGEFKRWNGVHSQDRYVDKPGFQILNTDISGGEGDHWVAAYRTPKQLYIYDSFGRPTNKLLRGLNRRMSGNGIKIVDADYDPEQKGDSEICGCLALSWLCVVRDLGIREALKI